MEGGSSAGGAEAGVETRDTRAGRGEELQGSGSRWLCGARLGGGLQQARAAVTLKFWPETFPSSNPESLESPCHDRLLSRPTSTIPNYD
jgi:hypothetical protein